MIEKVKRNESIYQYSLKHPNVSCATIGKIFRRGSGKSSKPISAVAIWRIIKRMKERNEKGESNEKDIC
jgi:hypothetical protein